MVENHHEPLVTVEQWEKVADLLTANRRIVGGGASYNRGNLHIFAGIENLDARMNELEKDRSQQFTMTDNEFMEQASYFILMQDLADKREVDFAKTISRIDPRVVKDFLGSITQNFCIKDGRVDAIRFKNGMEHRFLYKDEND
jgi:hypothetical protein